MDIDYGRYVQRKDPEKLLLAAKFLESIVSAGGWGPSASASTSGTSGFSVSGYSSGSRNDGDDAEAPPPPWIIMKNSGVGLSAWTWG